MALGGILAGALAGGAEAVQHNAQSQIEQKRAEALKQLDHSLAMERQDDSQQFQSSEREATQTYQTGRDETLHGYDQENTLLAGDIAMERERYAQGQQNYRATLPSGGMSDLKQAQLKELSSRRDALQEQVDNGMIADEKTLAETKLEIEKLNGIINSSLRLDGLGGGYGGNIGGDIADGLGLDGGNGAGAGDDGGSQPPPPPRPESADDIEQVVRGDREAAAARRAEREAQQGIEQEINELVNLSFQMGQGPRTGILGRQQAATEIRSRIDELLQSGQLNKDQEARLTPIMERAVQYGG